MIEAGIKESLGNMSSVGTEEVLVQQFNQSKKSSAPRLAPTLQFLRFVMTYFVYPYMPATAREEKRLLAFLQ